MRPKVQLVSRAGGPQVVHTPTGSVPDRRGGEGNGGQGGGLVGGFSRLGTEPVLDAPEMAVWGRRPAAGLVRHSDGPPRRPLVAGDPSGVPGAASQRPIGSRQSVYS